MTKLALRGFVFLIVLSLGQVLMGSRTMGDFSEKGFVLNNFNHSAVIH